MTPLFQRPYAVYDWTPESWQRDGWYFVAFRRLWRVRGWRIYEWKAA